MTLNRRQVVASILSSFALRTGVGGEQQGFETKFDLTGYDSAIVPRGHGMRIRLGKHYRARYPSRDQCMQLMAFYGSKRNVLIRTLDSTAAITDWSLSPDKVLTIRGFGPVAEIVTEPIGDAISDVANIYREWARDQFWVINATPSSLDYSIFAVASQASEPSFDRRLFPFLEKIPGPKACWLTQWRRHRFDQGFPDYLPKSSIRWKSLFERLDEEECSVYPYVNASLVDTDQESVGRQEKWLVKTENGRVTEYSNRKNHLKFCCPAVPEWQSCVLTATDRLSEVTERDITNIYYDVVTATQPRRCFARDHGHQPGDPYAWQRGARSILGQTSARKMAEGCAEIYLDKVDATLMHRYTDQENLVPLWHAVYGFLGKSVGWDLRKVEGIQNVARQVKRSRDFGVNCHGSPWMTERVQQLLMSHPECELWRDLQA